MKWKLLLLRNTTTAFIVVVVVFVLLVAAILYSGAWNRKESDEEQQQQQQQQHPHLRKYVYNSSLFSRRRSSLSNKNNNRGDFRAIKEEEEEEEGDVPLTDPLTMRRTFLQDHGKTVVDLLLLWTINKEETFAAPQPTDPISTSFSMRSRLLSNNKNRLLPIVEEKWRQLDPNDRISGPF
jgi:hypothetical protein